MVRKKQRRDEVLLQKIVLRIKELRNIHGDTQEKLVEGTDLKAVSTKAAVGVFRLPPPRGAGASHWLE